MKVAPRPAAIVLYPFTSATAADVAVALLAHHVAYHMQLGFAKVVQYTQARRPLAAQEPHFSVMTHWVYCLHLVRSGSGMPRHVAPPSPPCHAALAVSKQNSQRRLGLAEVKHAFPCL